ncbi:MAG: phosphotransferase [Dehalococcoidia bacterium]
MIASGLTSDVYGFRLEGSALRGVLAGPLVLRLSLDAWRGSVAEREVAAHQFVAARGYRVPAIAAVEATGTVLGQPFMVLARPPGRQLARRLDTWNVLTAHRLGTAFADAHVALHRLPVDGWPADTSGTSVERRLAPYRDWLGQAPDGPAAFGWLDAHRSVALPEERSICHNDFHPVNVIAGRDRSLSVIDWSSADLGDRHGDVAHTVVFMRTEPNRERGARRVRRWLARSVFLRSYLARYHAQLPLDIARLRYWEALHAFVLRGVLAALQSRAVGRRGSAGQNHEQQQAHLARYFLERKGEVERTNDRSEA